mmetsp:Transcript_1045/g.1630  ORF Transcript_1045/g.1630 Transcript_1045/m.1630 type:complete len:183 (+) Transcript_1045:57-605(+)
MGSYFSSLFQKFFGEQEVRILILGLDNAGKTTILYRLQIGEVVTTTPTIGFNIETIHYNNLKCQVWDLGGQTLIRPYWRCYYAKCDAIIYVIDSSDRKRLGIAKSELYAMLEEDELKDSILVIFANKQDIPNALSVEEITKELGLAKLKNRTWTIFKTSAKKNEGLQEGFKWLASQVENKSS